MAQGTYQEISKTNLDIKQIMVEKEHGEASEKSQETSKKVGRTNSTVSTAVSMIFLSLFGNCLEFWNYYYFALVVILKWIKL